MSDPLSVHGLRFLQSVQAKSKSGCDIAGARAYMRFQPQLYVSYSPQEG